MVTNIMNNLTLVLLVLALCALFPTNTQATNSLSEKYSKCEKDFWFKNLSHYKQSLKSKCLKEKHHHKEKRHRQHHLCNTHNDKKAIFSRWKKFSNCRCESALEDLKDAKDSKVLTCYQIVRFNKVTGKFIGQLSLYKKKSDNHKYDVAVKFSDIKLSNNKDNNWSKTKEGYYRSKQSTEICNDQYSIETHFIQGTISKKESMNKVSFDRVSPLGIKLFDKDSEKSITLSKDQQVLLPFPNFVLNDDNKLEPNPNDSKPKKSPAPGKQENPNSPNSPSDSSPDKQVKPNPPSVVNPYLPSDSPPNKPNTPPPGSDSPTTPPENDTPSSSNTDNDDSAASNLDSKNNVNAATNSGTGNVASSNQEATVNQSNSAFTGLLVFGILVAVGAAFVGYNTYERLKWRRHFRRGQAAAAQLNPSLANVPDYNGYGRAY